MKDKEELIKGICYILNTIKIESDNLRKLLEFSDKFELNALYNYLKEVEGELDANIQEIRNNIAWGK